MVSEPSPSRAGSESFRLLCLRIYGGDGFGASSKLGLAEGLCEW